MYTLFKFYVTSGCVRYNGVNIYCYTFCNISFIVFEGYHGGFASDDLDFGDNITMQHEINKLTQEVQRLRSEVKHWKSAASQLVSLNNSHVYPYLSCVIGFNESLLQIFLYMLFLHNKHW